MNHIQLSTILTKVLYSFDEVSMVIGRTPKAVRSLFEQGKIIAVRRADDRRLFIHIDDLKHFIGSHKIVNKPKKEITKIADARVTKLPIINMDGDYQRLLRKPGNE